MTRSSVLVPDAGRDRRLRARARSAVLFEEQGLVIQEWDRVRTDWLTIRDGASDGVLRLNVAGGQA